MPVNAICYLQALHADREFSPAARLQAPALHWHSSLILYKQKLRFLYLKHFAEMGPCAELQTLHFTEWRLPFCHAGHHATNLKRRGETSSMSSLKSSARCCRGTATLSRWTNPPYCRGPSTSYRNRKVLRAHVCPKCPLFLFLVSNVSALWRCKKALCREWSEDDSSESLLKETVTWKWKEKKKSSGDYE